MNIDATVRRIAALEDEAKARAEELRRLRAAVVEYLTGTGATRYVGEDVEAILRPGSPHFDFDGLLSKLGEHLGKEDYAEMFPEKRTCRMCQGKGYEPPVINGNVAKRIATYAPRNGVDFARVIDEHTTRDAPVLMVRRHE